MDTLAIYARVSDKGKQADNFSIESQLSLMRREAENQGYTVVELVDTDSAFIEGLSRSQLNRAREMARNHEIQALMFFSPDRFTRRMVDGVILRDELYKSGVKLFCFQPTPHEINSDLEILHVFADYVSQKDAEKRREATLRGVWTKVGLGLFPQGNVPYGYRLEGKRHETCIYLDEEEGRTIRIIFHWYLYEGVGCAEIANRLNGRAQNYTVKVPPPGEDKGADSWTARAVRKILKKTAYYGTWYAFTISIEKKDGRNIWHKKPNEEGVPIPVPPVVSRTMWDSVQSLLATRHIGRMTENRYLMAFRLACKCGKAAIGQRNRNGKTDKLYYYYRCNSWQAKGGKCGMSKWPAPNVDETVWQFAYEFIKKPERLIQGLRDMQEEDKEHYASVARQIETLKSRIAEATEELESIVEQRTKAKQKSLQLLLDQKAEEYAETIDELNTRLEALLSQQREAPYTDENIAEMVEEVTALRELYEALEEINQSADFTARRTLIDLLNLKASIRVDDDGVRWVDIHWLRKTYPRELWTQKTSEGRG
jgi:site-specific DNA recombinase